MNALSFIYVFVLFVILTPGVVVTLPPKTSRMIVVLIHGLLFTLILAFTYQIIAKMSLNVFEGYRDRK